MKIHWLMKLWYFYFERDLSHIWKVSSEGTLPEYWVNITVGKATPIATMLKYNDFMDLLLYILTAYLQWNRINI